MSTENLRRFLPGHHWEGVSLLAYKEDSGTFRAVTRQVLFEGRPDLPVQLRYFEVGPDGHTSLERHQHVHLVWISRGRGHVYLGGQVTTISDGDVLVIPGNTWHQFRAAGDEPLGFHCLVTVDRDKPHLPDEAEWDELIRDPAAREFLRR